MPRYATFPSPGRRPVPPFDPRPASQPRPSISATQANRTAHSCRPPFVDSRCDRVAGTAPHYCKRRIFSNARLPKGPNAAFKFNGASARPAGSSRLTDYTKFPRLRKRPGVSLNDPLLRYTAPQHSVRLLGRCGRRTPAGSHYATGARSPRKKSSPAEPTGGRIALSASSNAIQPDFRAAAEPSRLKRTNCNQSRESKPGRLPAPECAIDACGLQAEGSCVHAIFIC